MKRDLAAAMNQNMAKYVCEKATAALVELGYTSFQMAVWAEKHLSLVLPEATLDSLEA